MSDAPLPPLRTRLRRALRSWLILLALRAFGLLPLGAALALGRGLGSLAFRLVGGERRRTLAHLALAFPEKPEAERLRIARDAWRQLGMCAAEVAQERRIDARFEAYVEFPEAAQAVLRDALAEGKGVVLVTGHVGNWELLARRIGRTFGGITVVAREMNGAGHTDAMDAYRSRGAVRTLWRGRQNTTREMLRIFKENGVFGLLIDQDTKVQSVFVPFFGRLASTPRVAGDLSVRTGAPLVMAFIHRKAGGGHVVETERILVPATGEREADGIALTAAATLAIEARIRRHPPEWVWMHRRWKTRPEAGTAAEAEKREAATA